MWMMLDICPKFKSKLSPNYVLPTRQVCVGTYMKQMSTLLYGSHFSTIIDSSGLWHGQRAVLVPPLILRITDMDSGSDSGAAV